MPTVTLPQLVLVRPLVVLRARLKYVVTPAGAGITSEVPEPTSVTPQPPVYQSTVSPAPTVAESVTVLSAQTGLGVAAVPVGSAGFRGTSHRCRWRRES